ncbi:MAG: hypothetical protein AB1817_01895 [Chloroflexota bacterium]
MNCVLVIAQGLVGIICFTMPGLALLSSWRRRQIPTLPCAFVLAASFVLSSILIAGWEFAALNFFDSATARALTWLFVVAILLYTISVGWKTVASCFAPIKLWERRAFALIMVIVIGWLLTMPLSPYPSQSWLQLGDPPNYYHVAANLVAGKGWQPNYFIGDYLNGALSYVTAQPILVLVTTFFFQIFGVNGYSLYVYDALAGGLLIYLLAAFVCWRPSDEAISGKRIFFSTFGFACLPSFFILLGLGVVTAPGALAFATFTVIWIARGAPRAMRYLAALAATVFLLWVRPEAALLAMLLIVGGGIFNVFTAARLNRAMHVLGLLGFLIAVFLGWANLPIIVDALPTSFQSLGLFFVRFEPGSDQFVQMYVPYWELNRKLSQVNFGQVSFDEIKNGAIGLELSAHPITFLKFLIAGLGDTAIALVPALSFPEDIGVSPLLALTILGALVALAALVPEHRLIVVVIVAFLLCLPLLNFGAGIRHYLTIAPVLVALALRSVVQNWLGRVRYSATTVRRSTIWIAAGLMFVIVALDFSRLIAIRLAAENQSYAPILRDIQTATPPNALIASSYPQLITCVTGRPSVGTTWLAEDVELVVKKYAPEFVLIDNARDGPANYTLLAKRTGLTISGYVPVIHNAAQQYILFRAISSTTSSAD